MPAPGKTCIYYDGACYLCSSEIEHYKKKNHEGRLEFVDIAAPEFNAEKVGLDPKRVQAVMHVRAADGSIKTDIDAFIEIWKQLPGFGWAIRIASTRWLRPFLKLGYHSFAKVRPYLPKRKGYECLDNSCERK
jgi:predicted DCC family thiol-disulfide oxidoreductase YuxK